MKKINNFRFWARDSWVLLKTVFIIALILFVVMLPLGIMFLTSSDPESFKNELWIDYYAVFAFIVGMVLFYWLCLAPLPKRID